jgi:putative transcriptional regulator
MSPTKFHPKGSFVVLDVILEHRKTFASAFCRSERYFCRESDMIKCHLSRLMGERKLKIADVARDTGLHRNTITLLYDETAARVELDAIDKLCSYFHVSVGELFERVAEPPAKVRKR